MIKFISTTIAMLLVFAVTQAKSNQTNKAASSSAETEALKGYKFLLKYQAFASHDKASTDYDTVQNDGDYILFSENGIAYMSFKGQLDSISYSFIGKNAVSFGDTPFIIKSLGNGYYSLYQNEETKKGDYNRVTYLLKQDDENKISFSK
jgi:hypothetical protein